MITVYSKPNCPYCDQAKAWLDKYSFEYTVVDISVDADAKQRMVDAGHRTVPQIYLNETVLVQGGWAGLKDQNVPDLREKINA